MQYFACRFTDDFHGLVSKRTQSLADQCRAAIELTRRKRVLDSLVVSDEWQSAISEDPSKALRLVGQMMATFSQILLDVEIHIAAYIELTELVLPAEVKLRN